MTVQKTMSGRAWAELLLLSLIWGGSFLSIRIALDEVTFLWAVTHRVFWAAIILWIIVIATGQIPKLTVRLAGMLLVMGLLNNVLPFSLQAWGQLHIESGLVTIFNASTAIFGVVVATLVFADERLTPNRAIGVALGFLGVATAVGIGALLNFDLRTVAQLAVVVSAISYACAGTWARVFLSGLSPLVASAGMLTGSSLIMLCTAWTFEGPPDLSLQPATWGAIGYFAIIATACAYLLYFRVLAMAGAGNLLLCTLLIPPIGIVLGAWARAEALEPRAFVGFAILALGLIFLDGRLLRWRNRAGAKEPSNP